VIDHGLFTNTEGGRRSDAADYEATTTKTGRDDVLLVEDTRSVQH